MPNPLFIMAVIYLDPNTKASDVLSILHNSGLSPQHPQEVGFIVLISYLEAANHLTLSEAEALPRPQDLERQTEEVPGTPIET